jgi:enoyl-CoA hydratase/carnithine racemase
MMSDYSDLLYEVEDGIATITLNRPDRLNAISGPMLESISSALRDSDTDREVRVIVLTGAGRGFCAGADLKQLRGISEGERGREETPPELAADPGDPALEDFRGTYTYPMSIRKPVIAAINGPTAGMAVPIALACDMRFASERASFTTAFSRRGLVAEWGISWLLTRLVGPAHALDVLFSARKFDAAEAERIGLVNRVVPHDELLGFARSYVEDLAANCSPASMAVMKRQVYEHLMERLGPAEKEAVRLMIESFSRPDFREGVMSFMEKRPPKFQRV